MIFPVQYVYKYTLLETIALCNEIVAAFNEKHVLTVEDYYKMNDIPLIPSNAKEYRWESPLDFGIVRYEEDPKYAVYAKDPKHFTEGE